MKKGFTITEILITMGIIGVAAALVLPNMVSKINRNTVGITLSRAVELTEKGFADMFNVARENAVNATDFDYGEELIDPGSISRLSMLQERFFNGDQQDNHIILDQESGLMSRASSYIGVDFLDFDSPEGQRYFHILGDRELFSSEHLLSPWIYRFKKINAYLIYDAALDDSDVDANIAEDNPDIVIRRIFFDTNGENAPNEEGKDIFLFGLTDSGHLVPAGSDAYNVNIIPEEWNHTIDMNCDGSTIPNDSDDPSDRLSCTARVVRDNWRVNYSY